jgi:hypothetical protein
LITIKERYSGIPKKEISLCQPLDIGKLDLVPRKQQDIISILLFSIKANGDISELLEKARKENTRKDKSRKRKIPKEKRQN